MPVFKHATGTLPPTLTLLLLWCFVDSSTGEQTVVPLECPAHCQCPEPKLEGLDPIYFNCTLNSTSVRLMYNPRESMLHPLEPDALNSPLLRSFSGLQSLNLSGVGLTELPTNIFEDLTNLKMVFLNNNSLTHLPPSLWNNKPDIWAINFDDNQLEELALESFTEPTSLKRIFCNGNRIRLTDETFSKFKKLEWLHLGRNHIKQLPPRLLHHLTLLQEFDVRLNEIREVPDNFFLNSSHLEELYLGNNLLTSLPATFSVGLGYLRELYLENNKLERITNEAFRHLRRVTYLYLSNNRITIIDQRALEPLKNLQHLDLSYNRLEFKDGAPVVTTGLLLMNLSHNNLTMLEGKTWREYPCLADLDLSNNRLEFLHLSWLTFMYAPCNKKKYAIKYYNKYKNRPVAYTEIQLQNNRISTIDVQHMVRSHGTNNFEFVPRILIGTNPINCNCESLSLVKFLQTQQSDNFTAPFILVDDQLTCNQPADLKNERVSGIHKTSADCTSQQCPPGCQCITRSQELSIRVQCQDANLLEIPSIPTPEYNATILDLSNNPLSNATGIKEWITLISLDLTSSVRASEMKHLTVDLLPLYNLTVLKELVMSNNEIERLDANLFQGLDTLRLLDLSYNKLRTLLDGTFYHLSDLNVLYLHHNSITSLTDSLFERNLKLTELKLGYNNLTTTSNALAKTCQLRELSLEHNNLTNLSSGTVCLADAEIIVLSYNHISSLTPIMHHATKLSKLDLSYNNLSIFNVSDLRVMESGTNINLEHNKISHFFYPLNVPTRLKNLSYPLIVQLNSNPAWCDCKMQEFVRHLKNIPQIELVVRNLICKGPARLEGEKVQKLTARELTCENEECPPSCECFHSSSNNYNRLECTKMPDSIPPNIQHFTLTGGSFQSLDKLALPQWANLTDIKISHITGSTTTMRPSVFQNLTLLKTLSLVRSSVLNTDQKWLQHLGLLLDLDFSYNQIVVLSTDTFVGTAEILKLNLSHNSISELPDKLLHNMLCLETLDLSHNQIQILTNEFMRMGIHLIELYVSDNSITSIEYNALTICKNLIVLDLSHNNFGLSDVERLPNKIQKLDLSQNAIDKISEKWFELGHLKTIDLSFTKFHTIKLDDLVKFPVDSTIYLQNASVLRVVWFTDHTLNRRTSTSFVKITVVLDNNSITCDCQIEPLVKYLRQANTNHSMPIEIQARNLQCRTPDNVRGKSVALLKSRDLYCTLKACPISCECYFEAEGKNNVINCAKKVTGTLNLNYLYTTQVLILNNSSLHNFHDLSDSGWDNLIMLTFRNANFTTSQATFFADILWNKIELKYLDISHNNIRGSLLQNALRNTHKLQTLYLSSNLLDRILNSTFDNLEQLEYLDLSVNHLESLPKRTLLKLGRLRELNLAQNRISFFSQDFLPLNNQLQLLNLSYNSFGSLPTNVSFKQLPMLQVFDWSHNSIRLPEHSAPILPLSLTCLNVSNNELAYIGFQNWTKFSNLKLLDLSDNSIKSVNMRDLIFGNNSNTTVNLDRNYSLSKYSLYLSDSSVNIWKEHLFLRIDKTTISCECQFQRFIPETKLSYGNISVYMTVKQPSDCIGLNKEPYCSLTESCFQQCSCYKQWNTENKIVMNCTRCNLTKLPTKSPQKVTHLIADYNRIMEFNGLDDEMWSHVTHLSLRFNSMKTIGKRYPKTLQSIHLDNNNFVQPSGWLLDMIQNSSLTFNITLGKNPWMCDCTPQTTEFQNWLLGHNKRILDVKDILCDGTGYNVLTVQPCPLKWRNFIAPVGAIIIILMLSLLAVVVYFRHKTAVHMWLYSHGLCISEDLIDEDKEYDAFISYSSEDSDFVFEQLIPGLENSAPFYKLCIHERDWLAGMQILDQIALSVEKSRRTIVVLSANFVQSMWSGLEFQAAYHQSLRDHINRILIVVLGEIPPKDTLDPHLRMHVNLNTYLKTDDPRFLEKLRYVMPHIRKTKEKGPNGNQTLELVNRPE